MKPALAKAIIKDCVARGYVELNGVFYPPGHAAVLKIVKAPKRTRSKNLIKTGWIDDDRNIRNKANQRDAFMMFVEQQLQVEVWPEFYFSTERLYRFDYSIPQFKIAIEVNGGIWSKGNSGHSSGTGILRDYEKNNLAQSLGWKTIAVTPDQLMTNYTIDLIKQFIENAKGQ